MKKCSIYKGFKVFLWLPVFFLVIEESLVKAQDLPGKSELISDFVLFRNALQEAHPGLYRYTSKSDFDSIFAQSFHMIDQNMTCQEFYKVLVPVVDQVKCGHTKLHPDDNWISNFFFNTEHVFPWELHFEKNKAYVLGNYSDSMAFVPVGAQLVSINGKPIPEIITLMLPAFFSDGNNLTFKYLEMDQFFSAFYANLVEGPDTFAIVYKENTKLTEIKIPSIPSSVIVEHQRLKEELEAKDPPYAFEILSGETALLTISSFWREADNLNFKKFLKNSFRIIRNEEIQNLIIDLRNNQGGIDRRGALLMSYLADQKFGYYHHLELTSRKRFSFTEHASLPKFYGILRLLVKKKKDGSYRWIYSKNLKEQKPRKDNFDGKVYVLINGASFSVTAEFAAVAHYLKRATFIGEETGGGYYGNNSGAFAIVTLPNSRLNLGIPLISYYMDVDSYPYPDRGVIPDYEVKPSISEILSGEDVVLDFTLRHIDSLKATQMQATSGNR